MENEISVSETGAKKACLPVFKFFMCFFLATD